MQKLLHYNDEHIMHVARVARVEGSRRGYLRVRLAAGVGPVLPALPGLPGVSAGGPGGPGGPDGPLGAPDGTCPQQQGPRPWRAAWCALHQNLLFCFESEGSARPHSVFLLEDSACERPHRSGHEEEQEEEDGQMELVVRFGPDGQGALHLRALDEGDRDAWVAAISRCSYESVRAERDRALHKYQRLLRLAEAEKALGASIREHLDEQESEADKLRAEVVSLNRSKERMYAVGEDSDDEDEDPDIRKIKKVQSFLRGWLCRRKWKAIVQDYIRSPQAESRRKRNQLVFSMLEAEGEYVAQLRVLVTGFLRPLRMAASSKRPPICHDDVSAVFLNSETIMFLHQIFHQGLKARIASWPTIVLADLFDMLLPMLNIYQEFVRNHQFSLQVLANCKQNREFDKLLKQYESRAECEERTLETFLTFPMYQIPRYIVTLHELLAHTPQEHVERRSLEFAKSKLEELSRIIHDEVSETENIRKNLAIERMIVEGCGILLDTSQTFVRQGSLLQVSTAEKGRMSRGRLGSLTSKKEGERQCFLFTKHLIICTRASGGKLHLNKNGGVLPLLNCTLLEDLEPADDEARSAVQDLEFRLAIEAGDTPPCIVLVAASRQQKAAWTSDISQCIDNLRCNGLMMNVFEDNSKISVPQMVRSDRSLYCDGADIRFSRTLDSCKVPVIRAASVSRLLERLTDPRFLSIDFLNTFLYSYRVFTTATALLARLAAGYRRPLSAVPASSLELFFSSSLPGRPHYGEPPKSPRACRKFSTPLSPTSPPGAVIVTIATSPPPGTSGGSGGGAVIVGVSVSVSVSVSEAPAASDTDVATSPLAAAPATAGATVSEPASPLTSPTCLPAPGAIAGVPSPFRGRRKMSLNAPLIHEPPVHAALPRGADDAAASSAGSPDGRGGSGGGGDARRSPLDAEQHETGPLRSPSTPRHRSFRHSEFPLFHVGSTAEVGGETQEKIRRLSLAGFSIAEHRMLDKEFIIRRAVTNRVLNVLRHWVSKHSQDFESDSDLKSAVVRLLEEISRDTELIGQERKAAANILRTLTQEESEDIPMTVEQLALTCEGQRGEAFESFTAMELAEQLTLLDHLVFRSIPYEEFFGQGWMKLDKHERAPHIMRTSKHFNEMSNLVASEVVRRAEVASRAAAIEKWVAVADVCRCLNNYNGVLEIHSALNRTAVFRLKKTWLKVSKQTKTLFEKMQKALSSEGRFKNLREMLKSCDPPCVPYLGMYLTDLAFIEEATPNLTDDCLVNFSKMRMITHILREVRQFQQTPYKLEPDPRTLQYLLERSMLLDDDSLYELSLQLEPRLPT
ncbi:ras-specific guanine nucleotide-releasing factor 2-like isoform X2 [Lampetra fluviatilis]